MVMKTRIVGAAFIALGLLTACDPEGPNHHPGPERDPAPIQRYTTQPQGGSNPQPTRGGQPGNTATRSRFVSVVFTVNWAGARGFSMIFDAGSGVERDFNKSGRWAATRGVPVGKRVWVTATPTLDQDRNGSAFCVITQVNDDGSEKVIGAMGPVDRGSVECVGVTK
jgi:hypothetical protein